MRTLALPWFKSEFKYVVPTAPPTTTSKPTTTKSATTKQATKATQATQYYAYYDDKKTPAKSPKNGDQQPKNEQNYYSSSSFS